MKKLLLFIGFCLVAVFGFSQDKVVLKKDTIDCTIVGIEVRGVVFEFDGNTRVAGLDMVKAVRMDGKWMQNAAIRMQAAEGAVFASSSEVEPIVKAEKYPENTVAYHFDRAGIAFQSAGLVTILSYLVAGILASGNPDVALIVAGTGSVAGLVGIAIGGSHMRKAATLSR